MARLNRSTHSVNESMKPTPTPESDKLIAEIARRNFWEDVAFGLVIVACVAAVAGFLIFL